MMKLPLALSLLSSLGATAATSSLNEQLIETYQRRATHAADKLTAFLDSHKEGENRLLQEDEEEEKNFVNCNHRAVNDWVTEHVQGGRCEDFNTVVGGVDMCRRFQDYNDPVQCMELDQNPTFDIGSGGMGPSQAEQCLFFVNHLLPHPYFLDLDSILPVFGSGFDYPYHHECQSSDVHECRVDVVFDESIPPEFLAPNTTAPPTPAPFTETVPCTRCDFFYASDDVCFEADCRFFHCEDTLEQEQVRMEQDENRTIEVCFANTRSDIFSFTEHRIGEYYGCSVGTEEKVWTTEFHKGVTNVREITFKLGEHSDGNHEIGLDFCELSVDGTVCSSCIFCASNDTNPHIAIDCNNVIEGAATSCDSEDDFLYGISAKLANLQEGFTRGPTPAPVAANQPAAKPPTAEQQQAVTEEVPIAEEADAAATTETVINTEEGNDGSEALKPTDTVVTPTESDSPGSGGGLEADQMEGAAISGGIIHKSVAMASVAIVMSIALL